MKKSAAQIKVEALAAELGATVIINTEYAKTIDVSLEAPDGMVFKAMTDVHGTVGCNIGGAGEHHATHPKRRVWEGLYEDLKEGFVPCEIEDCEVCNDE